MKGVNFMKNKPKSNAGGGCDRCGSFFNGIRDVIIIGTQYNIWLEKCSVLWKELISRPKLSHEPEFYCLNSKHL